MSDATFTPDAPATDVTFDPDAQPSGGVSFVPDQPIDPKAERRRAAYEKGRQILSPENLKASIKEGFFGMFRTPSEVQQTLSESAQSVKDAPAGSAEEKMALAGEFAGNLVAPMTAPINLLSMGTGKLANLLLGTGSKLATPARILSATVNTAMAAPAAEEAGSKFAEYIDKPSVETLGAALGNTALAILGGAGAAHELISQPVPKQVFSPDMEPALRKKAIDKYLEDSDKFARAAAAERAQNNIRAADFLKAKAEELQQVLNENQVGSGDNITLTGTEPENRLTVAETRRGTQKQMGTSERGRLTDQVEANQPIIGEGGIPENARLSAQATQIAREENEPIPGETEASPPKPASSQSPVVDSPAAGKLSDEAAPAAARPPMDLPGGIMVSPNIAEIDYPRAKKNLTSDEQGRLKSIAADVAPNATIHNAIGDWKDGAENSVAVIYNEPKTLDETRLAAAQLGLAGDQKAVLHWVYDANGADAIHQASWPKDVTIDQARQALIDSGLEFRTLIETPDGVQAILFDQGQQNLDNFVRLGDHETNPIIDSSPATGEFLGSWNNRAEGRRAYREVLGGAEEAPVVPGGEGAAGRSGDQPEAASDVGPGGGRVAPTLPFPLAQPKAAFLGERGAIGRELLTSPGAHAILGGVAGGAVGVTKGNTPEERIKNAIKYAFNGALATYGGSKLVGARGKILTWAKTAGPEETLSFQLDRADNLARITAERESQTDVGNALRRALGATEQDEVARRALTFIRESGNDRAVLQTFRARLAAATPKGGVTETDLAQARAAVDRAIADFDKLLPVSDFYKVKTDAQLSTESAMGRQVGLRSDYVPHAQDVDFGMELPFDPAGGTGAASGFQHARVHDTYVDSMEAGVRPQSLDAVDLLQHRLSRGQAWVNRQLWLEGAKAISDPTTASPLVADLLPGTKIVDGKAVADNKAPPGYMVRNVGGKPVAILQGYQGAFASLLDPSWMQNSQLGGVLVQGASTIKHAIIAADTYHMGRVAFHGTTFGLNPFEGGKNGSFLLKTSADEIDRMAGLGEIPQSSVPEFKAQWGKVQKGLDAGLNVGSVGDALYSQQVRQIPGIGKYNKWLFETFQRGIMAHAFINEFDRLKAAQPALAEADVARQAAKGINIRFGNLQNQSWIKSKGFQDMMRTVFLAPGWNEGLARSEIGAATESGKAVINALSGRQIVAGPLMKNVGTIMVATFVGNQLLNYATRGHPTWQNPEEGVDSKLSAWVPDYVGKGPGFFLSPFSLPAELTGQVIRQFEKKGTVSQALQDVIGFKLGPIGRAANTLITRRDAATGKTLVGDKEIAGGVAEAMLPVPIQAPAIYQTLVKLSGGNAQEDTPGQIQKQAFGSFGVRLENAPSDSQRIHSLAADFKRQNNIPTEQPAAESDYAPFSNAIRVNNPDAGKFLDQLLQKRSPEEVIKYFQAFGHRPYTGSSAHETEFKKTLSPEQLQTYERSLDERYGVAAKALTALKAKADAGQIAVDVPLISNDLPAQKIIDQQRQIHTEKVAAESTDIKTTLAALRTAAPAERIRLLQQVGATHPEMLDKIISAVHGGSLDNIEKQLHGLDATGRANFVIEKVKSLPSAERAAYLLNLQQKGILTEPVAEQMARTLKVVGFGGTP